MRALVAVALLAAVASGCHSRPATPSSPADRLPARASYPAHWFAPVSPDGAPEWEILPQAAGPGEVIVSKRHELGLLSNFAATPFDFRGVRYASVEGFWQMMLYPEGAADPRAAERGVVWAYSRAQVAQLTGFEAKQAGALAEANMTTLGITWASFEGVRFEYRPAVPGAHHALVVAAMREKVRQNPEVRRVLLSTGDLVLKPDHREEPGAREAWRYCEILTQIRDELRRETTPAPNASAHEGVEASAAGDAIVPERPTPLWNGRDLSGWKADVPAKDAQPDAPDSFIVRDGLLVSLGVPPGHLLTEARYKDYRLEVEYRFPGKGGNCGVLVHASRLRALAAMFPQSIEVQMMHGNAGDFWCIEENIEVADMETRRPHREGQKWGGSSGDARRILNLTDGSEKPLGEWNTLVIEARGRTLRVWLNGDLVNDGFNATADSGRIALQAEGTEVEFRKVEIAPLRTAQ